jgi:tetraacyldisaccharide 4'-kinase
MKTPEFFFHGQGIWPRLLSPLSVLWQLGAAIKRNRSNTRQMNVPVICVGNLTVGGTGKTPVVIALAHYFRHAGLTPHIITRGHGGKLEGPVKVDATTHIALDVGDEALLLTHAAPTWMAKDRAAAAEAAEKAGADLILMDDGHQNFSIAKDYALVVIDRAWGFGSGRIMPAGPLREPIAEGLARANAVVLLAGGDHVETTNWRQPVKDAGLPVIRASLETGMEAEQFVGQKVVAFAGIGRPEKFFTTLENLKCDIVERRAFADHHPYTPDDIMQLVDLAAINEARPVTTSKDFARLPPEARAMVSEIPVGLGFENSRTLDDVFADLLKQTTRHNA